MKIKTEILRKFVAGNKDRLSRTPAQEKNRCVEDFSNVETWLLVNQVLQLLGEFSCLSEAWCLRHENQAEGYNQLRDKFFKIVIELDTREVKSLKFQKKRKIKTPEQKEDQAQQRALGGLRKLYRCTFLNHNGWMPKCWIGNMAEEHGYAPKELLAALVLLEKTGKVQVDRGRFSMPDVAIDFRF